MERRLQCLVPLLQGWGGGGKTLLCLTSPTFWYLCAEAKPQDSTEDLTPRFQADTTGILTDLLGAYFPVLNNVVLWSPVSFY